MKKKVEWFGDGWGCVESYNSGEDIAYIMVPFWVRVGLGMKVALLVAA